MPKKQVEINIWNWVFSAIFYFRKSFFDKNMVSPQDKYSWQELFKSARLFFFFFFDPPFQNVGLKVVPYKQKRERLMFLKKQLRIETKIYRQVSLINRFSGNFLKNLFVTSYLSSPAKFMAQKMFCIKDFYSKHYQLSRFLRIYSYFKNL